MAVLHAPRDIRATRAWKVGHYAVQPVTIRYPDGRVVVVTQEPIRPPRRKSRKASKARSKARVARVTGVTPIRLTRSERIAMEWEIFNKVDNTEREQYN